MTISASLRGVLCASVSVAAVFAASSAAAQAANTSQPAANSGEVVVTARRTAESIRTVPMAVSAFGAQKLKEESITQTSDLMFHVPGIFLGGAFDQNNTTYILRGVGPAGQQGQFNPGVMSYFAEVPLPTNAQSQPQYDISNIQVLKGPQGTLFGKNTTGGAVLVYPNTPSYSGYSGYVEGTFGSYNWREGDGAINLPIVPDKLAIRIAAHAAQRDGFIKNVTPGGLDGSGVNNWGFRAQVRWDPTAQVSNNLMFDYYSSKTANVGVSLVDCNTVQPASPPFPACTATDAKNAPLPPTATLGLGTIGYGSYFKTATPPGLVPYSNVLQWGVTDRLEVHLSPSVEFVNIASYRRAQFNSFDNQDGTALGLFQTTQLTNEEDWTEEAQFKGDSFDSKVHWTVGGFYSKSTPLAGNAFYNIIAGGAGPAGYPFYSRQSEAIYGNGIIHLDNLLQGLEADLGLRYTWDQFNLCTAVQNNPGPVIPVTPAQCASPPSGQIGFTGTAGGGSSAPTWSFGLNWNVNQHLFLYAVTRRGYRSGGVNGPSFTGALAALQTYKPELVTDFEFGERSNFTIGGMRASLDMDYFRAQTSNVQQTAARVSTTFYNQLAALAPFLLPPGSIACGLPGGASSFDGNCNTLDDPIQTELEFNAGSLVASGFEFGATISPIQNLTFSGGGTIYNFQFSAGANAIPPVLLPFYQAFLCKPGQGPSQCLASSYGVKQTYTAGAHYSLPLSQDRGTLVFNMDFYWSGPRAQLSLYTPPAYDIINLRLDWNHVMGGPVDLSLFAKNVGNTIYAISGGNTLVPAFAKTASPPGGPFPSGAIVMGEPRMIGGEIRYSFGH